MPIGNLTSQIFANVYLDGLDHYIKEKLRWKAYCRYVDDFIFFGNCKNELHTLKREIESYLEGLRLKTHSKKSLVFPSKLGVEFLGFRIFRDYMKVRKSTVKSFKQRLIQYKKQYQEGKIRPQKISMSIESWLAHASHGNNYTIARDLLREVSFCRAA
ncbi:MAG: hypothetical protein A3K09_05450 [Nitrospinae bacterium RIFCSPLOWO2_12_FULL_47_7]|nr:MAG: hypothetical protein A3K09_05450 [Nitrospinae bacterium RIFCSPLOWO2_12_FULL_47_7]